MTPEELELRARLVVGAIAVFAVITDIIAFFGQPIILWAATLRLLWDCYWIYALFQGNHDARLFLAIGLLSGICGDVYTCEFN